MNMNLLKLTKKYEKKLNISIPIDKEIFVIHDYLLSPYHIRKGVRSFSWSLLDVYKELHFQLHNLKNIRIVLNEDIDKIEKRNFDNLVRDLIKLIKEEKAFNALSK